MDIEDGLCVQAIEPRHFFFRTLSPDVVKRTVGRIALLNGTVITQKKELRSQVAPLRIAKQGIIHVHDVVPIFRRQVNGRSSWDKLNAGKERR